MKELPANLFSSPRSSHSAKNYAEQFAQFSPSEISNRRQIALARDKRNTG